MLTDVGAWLAAVAVCLGAVLFGQTARTAPPRRRRSRSRRIGLFLSLSGPWLAVLVAAGVGAFTGAWLLAAAAAAVGVVVVALVGLSVRPR